MSYFKKEQVWADMEEEQRTEDRRVKKTKNAIKEAFQSLLQEKKYSEITVRELTEKADITRKTFYLHYGALEDVLREFLEELMHDAREGIIAQDISAEGSGTSSGSGNDDFAEMFASLNRNFEREHIKVINLINDDIGRHIVYQYIMERQKLVWENYQDQYGMTPEKARLFGTFRTYGFIAMYMTWYSDSDSVPLEEFAEMTHDISASLSDLLKKWKNPLPH